MFKVNSTKVFFNLWTEAISLKCQNIYSILHFFVIRITNEVTLERSQSLNALRKHAYSNILKISPPKTESFRIKIHISAQNIDCAHSLEPPRRGGSNEYLQSMFKSRNNTNNVYPFKPQCYDIRVGFKRIKIIKVCFVMTKQVDRIESTK